MNTAGQTVFSVFISRCRDLGTETRGVALAATLAFFAPIYLIVVGIYGVGEIVRYKIELQNAADAAAYSASVVQADYLSRIAVVNKALAWTYVDLQKRSLDYYMDAHIRKVIDEMDKDKQMTQEKAHSQGCYCLEHNIWGTNYFVGQIPKKKKRRLKQILRHGVQSPGNKDQLQVFNTYGKEKNGPSRPGKKNDDKVMKSDLENEHKTFDYSSKKKKIEEYKKDIDNMNQMLIDLQKEMNQEVKDAALETAVANMEECEDEYIIKIIGDGGTYDKAFEKMKPTDSSEKDFISFADMQDSDAKYGSDRFSPKDVFGPGTDYWVKLDKSRQTGFLRVYDSSYENENGHIYASWYWAWGAWKHKATCKENPCKCTEPKMHYKYKEHVVKGTDVDAQYGFSSKKPFQNNKHFGGYINAAEPWILKTDEKNGFFGELGTITVAIARKTYNPLSVFTGKRTVECSGMLSAFNPSICDGHRPEYMLAVASARAGFKAYDDDKEQKRNSNKYMLGNIKLSDSDRKKQWNLCEADWDGMMVPVRYANSYCSGTFDKQEFSSASDDILSKVIQKSDWVDKDGKAASDVPDWENMEAPAGMVEGGKKLEWSTLGKYLRH